MLSALAEDGVGVLVLKGAALQATVYGIDERAMQDADLLVAPASVERTAAALKRCGLRPIPDPKRPLGARLFHARGYAHASGVQVDLHTALAATGRWRVDTAGLFERALPCDFDGVAGRRLSNEDLLLHLAINLAKDDLAGAARCAQDVRRVLAALPMDWSITTRRARAWGCTAALWLLLRMAAASSEVTIPQDVWPALKPGVVRHWWLARLLDAGGEPDVRWAAGSRRLRQIAMVPVLSDRPMDALRATVRFGVIRLADLVLGA